MNQHFSRFTLVCMFFSLLAYSACSSIELSPETVQGKWELTKATRNNKTTNSLDGTFFDFGMHEVKSNIKGNGVEQYSYSIVNDELNIEDPVLERLSIHQWTDSTMVLYLHINSDNIELNIRKQSTK